MSDDDSSTKRLKTAEDGSVNTELRRRIAELESEVQHVRSDVVHLRSENVELRRRVRQLDGIHEVLPVVVPPATVDVSRIDSSIVTQITSFLGTSSELMNLALTCKFFGFQPASGLNWSMVEEVARQAVCSRATDAEMDSLPQYVSGTTTWLSILHWFENPLIFVAVSSPQL